MSAPPAVIDPNSRTPAYDRLTARQKLFVDHWLVTLNRTKAALAAGYSAASAGSIGSELLKKPEIAKAVAECVAANPRVSAARIIEETAAIAFANAQDFFRWGPGFVSIKSPDEIPEESMAAIAGLVETPGQFGNKLELKLHDKGAALERLAKICRLFGDKGDAGTSVTVNVNTGVMLAPAAMSDDEWFAAAKRAREQQAEQDALPVVEHEKA